MCPSSAGTRSGPARSSVSPAVNQSLGAEHLRSLSICTWMHSEKHHSPWGGGEKHLLSTSIA